MGIGIINRMILAELVKVFLISLIALTGMFLVGDLIQEAMRKGLSPWQILAAIPFFIPNMLPFTIPATTLFATSLVYGRMSDDNEVLVLRASGMNIYRLLWPAVALGVMTTAWTAFLYYETIPRTRVLLREHVLADAEGVIYRLIQRDGGLSQPDIDFVLFVREVQGRDLLDVIVKKHTADRTAYSQVVWANSATIRVEFRPGDSLVRREKALHTTVGATDPDDSVDRGTKSDNVHPPVAMPFRPTGGRPELIVCLHRCFWVSTDGTTSAEMDYLEFVTPLPAAIFGQETRGRPSTQTWEELFEHRAEVNQSRADRTREAEMLEAQAKLVSGDESRRLRKKAQITREGDIRYLTRLHRGIESEMHMRPALAVGCLCFALVGCPVGIGVRRSDYLGVFLFCFLPTTFVYYLILLFGLRLSNDGSLPPAIFWLPNVLAIGASIALIKWLMKR